MIFFKYDKKRGDIMNLWINLFWGLGGLFIGLFVKDLFPAYAKKKGENLATKQDIADITQKQEEVKADITKQLSDYNRKNDFRMKLQYERYDKLYSRIYSNICQSELFRIIIEERQGFQCDFEEYPFFDIESTRLHTTINLENGMQVRQETLQNDFTKLNKKQLCQYIIDRANYASSKLLKIAIAYRFMEQHYGDGETPSNNAIDYFNHQELRLLKNMIETILLEHQELINELELEFNVTQHSNTDFNIYRNEEQK